MHPLMLQQVIASCRERIAQGDCPTTTPFSVEQLEEAVVELAAQQPEAPAPGYWAGGNSIAARCHTCKKLTDIIEFGYRCAHCDLWFCKACALIHFGRLKPNEEPYWWEEHRP